MPSLRGRGSRPPQSVVTGHGAPRVICERCTIADSPLVRMRGLLGRTGLDPGEGILLRPAPSIHTFFMRFPIDALFLDWDLRVLAIEENMRPWRAKGCRGARAVLEIAAGEAKRHDVREGDRLRIEDPRPPRRVSEAEPVADVAQLHVQRVLLVSHDRRFLRMAAALLSAQGHPTETTEKHSDVVAHALGSRATAVVIDASGAVTDAVRMAAAVEATCPAARTVLVADDGGVRAIDGMRVSSKWELSDLLAAVAGLARETETPGDGSLAAR